MYINVQWCLTFHFFVAVVVAASCLASLFVWCLVVMALPLASLQENSPGEDRSVVMINDREQYPKSLEEMVEIMKKAVAMDIGLQTSKDGIHQCALSLYLPNTNNNSKANNCGSARRERLREAATMSSAQTARRIDCKWLGTEPYDDALSKGGLQHHHYCFGLCTYRWYSKPLVDAFASYLGLLILRNARLVECLRIEVRLEPWLRAFLEEMFAVDAWEGAFPSLEGGGGVYLSLVFYYEYIDEGINPSPNLMKRVRGFHSHLKPHFRSCTEPNDPDGSKTRAYQERIGQIIRNRDYRIEEFRCTHGVPYNADVLDDALRSVRSFHMEPYHWKALNRIAESCERTKEVDRLVRLSVKGSYYSYPIAPACDKILRLRPNVQVLNLGDTLLDEETFVALCSVVATSNLTALQTGLRISAEKPIECVTDALDKLLRHPTLRNLKLNCSPYLHVTRKYVNSLVRCVADRLRSTVLKRFCWSVNGPRQADLETLKEVYERLEENRSLMEIRLEGRFWRHPSYPLTSFDHVSLRNQYCALVFAVSDESTLPSGLWPLILESASDDASILYYLLTVQPHLVTGRTGILSDRGRARQTFLVGPSPKRRRMS